MSFGFISWEIVEGISRSPVTVTSFDKMDAGVSSILRETV
jgi:hypothetical protein